MTDPNSSAADALIAIDTAIAEAGSLVHDSERRVSALQRAETAKREEKRAARRAAGLAGRKDADDETEADGDIARVRHEWEALLDVIDGQRGHVGRLEAQRARLVLERFPELDQDREQAAEALRRRQDALRREAEALTADVVRYQRMHDELASCIPTFANTSWADDGVTPVGPWPTGEPTFQLGQMKGEKTWPDWLKLKHAQARRNVETLQESIPPDMVESGAIVDLSGGLFTPQRKPPTVTVGETPSGATYIGKVGG